MADYDWAALQRDAQDTLLADGEYTVLVLEATPTKSSNDKPMIKLVLTVAEGPKRDRKLWTQFVLTTDNPFALQRWFANLAAFGLDQAYFATNPTIEKIAADLVNRGAVATVGHRAWQGTDRNEVQSVRPYAPNGPTPPGMIIGPAVAGPTRGPVSTPPTAPSRPSTPPPAAPTVTTPASPPDRSF